MLCFPNCKINIGLYVSRRRDDGYHDIETVFYPLPLHDSLEVTEAAKTRLHLSGPTVAGDEQDNLVWKALELMRAAFPGRIPHLDIYLHKTVPMGAGLGGGSADGAFMLRLLNDKFTLGLNDTQLAAFALQLGSDCPFFIYNTPRVATGRGEITAPVAVDLSAYSIQLICPHIHISTARAFSLLAPKPAPYDLRQLPNLPIEQWRTIVHNDFEEPVFHLYPELGLIKEQLYAQGAHYASMSGSGSAIYGIFGKEKKAQITAGVPFEEFCL